jgi:hypothetical protein
MSFRLFVFCCAVYGAASGLLGWLLGRLPLHLPAIAAQAVKGLCLGLAVALVLGLLDALWNYSSRRVFQVVPRFLLAGLVGGAAGFLGGALGEALYGRFRQSAFLVLGWTFTGLLIGASLGAFDLVGGFVRPAGLRGAMRKVINGAVGGLGGGLLGSVLNLVILATLSNVFPPKEQPLRTPSAVGFLVLGACIGLLIGLAQVLLKEAWIRVEAGFRPGRELILTRPEITLGRSESCDIGLFGDPGVEPLHARIVRQGERFFLHDAGSRTGTFVNEQLIGDGEELRSGDSIRLGRAVLRFGERRRQPALEG